MLHSREVLAYMDNKGTAKPMGYEENPMNHKDDKLSFPSEATPQPASTCCYKCRKGKQKDISEKS